MRIHLTEMRYLLEGGDGSGNFEHRGNSPNVGGSSSANYPTTKEFLDVVGQPTKSQVFSIFNKASAKVGADFDRNHINRALGVLQTKGWSIAADGTFTSASGWKCTKNGCNCPDTNLRKIQWCKHRLARAILIKLWQNSLKEEHG